MAPQPLQPARRQQRQPRPLPAPAPVAANVPPPPDYTEITDDMAPDEKRRARIENSKARSAYNKQLKAMGIDP